MAFKKSVYSHTRSYNIGDMCHCVSIQKRFESPNYTNDISIIQGFKTIFEINCFWKNLKADYIETDENGYSIAESLKSVKNAEMVIPYRSNIDCECFVVYNKFRYKILDIENIDNRGIFMKCSLMSMGSIELKGNEGI